jgi:hypothetical protein
LMACMAKRAEVAVLEDGEASAIWCDESTEDEEQDVVSSVSGGSVSNCVQGCVYLVPRQCRLLACG